MKNYDEIKNNLILEECFLFLHVYIFSAEGMLIYDILKLYFKTYDDNLLKWAFGFLSMTVVSSFIFDYVKDEYIEDKKEFKYFIGDNYE